MRTLVDGFDHVPGYGLSGLVGNGTGNGSTDPPCRQVPTCVAFAVVEFYRRLSTDPGSLPG